MNFSLSPQSSYNFHLADDLIKEIRVITDTIKSSNCNEECLKITISQQNKICRTPTIFDIEKGSDNTFSGTQIGVCHNFSINTNLPLDLKFQHLTDDAWKGKAAIVHTRSNSFDCDPINGWLDRKGKQGEAIGTLTINCKASSSITTSTPTTTPTSTATSTSTTLSSKTQEEIEKEAEEILKPDNIKKLNLLLDPSKMHERSDAKALEKEKYDKNFGGMDMVESYRNLFEILWYSQLPCFDVKNITSNSQGEAAIIKKCYWKGEEMHCPSIFKTLPTDRGMCCVFNMNKAEEIFQESIYARLIQTSQDKDLDNR